MLARRPKGTESHRWRKMQWLHRPTSRWARIFSACSGVRRSRRISGSSCMGRRQRPALSSRDEASCWQSRGASSIHRINWLTRRKKPVKDRGWWKSNWLPSIARAGPNQRGEHADLGSPGSIATGVADGSDGRSNSRGDPLRADCTWYAPAVLAAAVRAIGDFPQHRRASLRPVVDGGDRRVTSGVGNLCGRAAFAPAGARACDMRSARSWLADAHADAAAAGARAAFPASDPQSSAVRFLSGPAERGSVFRSRRGGVCCRPTFRTAARRVSPNMAIRQGFRPCARRLPTIWLHRAASSLTPAVL